MVLQRRERKKQTGSSLVEGYAAKVGPALRKSVREKEIVGPRSAERNSSALN